MSHDLEGNLKLEFLQEDSLKAEDNECELKTLPLSASPLFRSKLISATKLTHGDDVKTVFDVVLDIQHIDYEFEPGNTIGIIAHNDKLEVDRLIERLNLTPVADKNYELHILKHDPKKKISPFLHIPTCGTIYKLFQQHLDIRSFPKKAFLQCLLKYTKKEDEIERLQRFCSPAGSEDYIRFFQADRSLLNLLNTFPSCQPTIECLLAYLPPLLPRPYSISSSFLDKNTLHIVFDVVNLPNGTKGVCTGWLEKLAQADDDIASNLDSLRICDNGTPVPFYFRKSNNFKLPPDPSTPIIMIATGTGIAPFLGFLEHRFYEHSDMKIKHGDSCLIYGCRYSDRDFLHKAKIDEYVSGGILTNLYSCCSREGAGKVYVQDIIKERSVELTEKIVRGNGVVFVCGNLMSMVKDVQNAFVSCLVNDEGMSSTDAKAYVRQLQKTDRYVQDIWV